MSTKSFYSSRKSSSHSSLSVQPKKKQRLDSVRVGEAIRMSHGVTNEKVVESLDDVSDLSDSDDESIEGSRDLHEQGPAEAELSFGSTPSNNSMYTFDHVSSTPVTPCSRPHSSASGSASGSGSGSERSNDRLMDLIQRQNQLIIELLGKQDGMTNAIEEVKRDLKETRSDVNKLMEVQQNKPEDTGKKQKRMYPSSLTDRLSTLHQSCDKQFNPEKGFRDPYNVEVKVFLKSEIAASHKGEYTDKQVSAAVQRLYESQRRYFLNSKPENAKRAQDSEIRKKYRARRERLFARRSRHVPQKLRKCWDRLNLHYMSEEQDEQDGDAIVVKKLQWRSDKLNDLIVKLDAAADVAAKSVPTFTPERKQRVVSPPADAPDWAVQPEYRKNQASNKEN